MKKDPGSYQDGGCPGNDKEIQQKSKLQGFGFIIETTTGKAARFPCGMGVSLGSRRMASRPRDHDLVAPIGLAKWLQEGYKRGTFHGPQCMHSKLMESEMAIYGNVEVGPESKPRMWHRKYFLRTKQ